MTRTEAENLEKIFIKLFNTTDNKYGYNVSLGGLNPVKDNGKPVKQYDLDGNFIKEYPNMVEAAKAIGLENDRSRISIACRNHGLVYGYMFRYADEVVDYCYESKTHKPVFQFSLNGELIKRHRSIVDAAKSVQSETRMLSNTLNKKKDHVHREYVWVFEKDIDKVNDYIDIYLNTGIKGVCQFDIHGNLINSFDTIKSASIFSGINSSCISSCCSHKIKTSGGYIWMYKKEIVNINNEFNDKVKC